MSDLSKELRDHIPNDDEMSLAGKCLLEDAADEIDSLNLTIVGLREQLVKARSEITKLAADCHRSKWQFDYSEEDPPTRLGGRELLKKAFSEIHRIGDAALKARDALTDDKFFSHRRTVSIAEDQAKLSPLQKRMQSGGPITDEYSGPKCQNSGRIADDGGDVALTSGQGT